MWSSTSNQISAKRRHVVRLAENSKETEKSPQKIHFVSLGELGFL